MLSAASLERQKQPTRIKSRKSSPIQLADVRCATALLPNSLVSPFKGRAPSCADFIKPSRPDVRAGTLAAGREQGRKRPWE